MRDGRPPDRYRAAPCLHRSRRCFASDEHRDGGGRDDRQDEAREVDRRERRDRDRAGRACRRSGGIGRGRIAFERGSRRRGRRQPRARADGRRDAAGRARPAERGGRGRDLRRRSAHGTVGLRRCRGADCGGHRATRWGGTARVRQAKARPRLVGLAGAGYGWCQPSRGERRAKSSAISSNVAHRTPSCPLMCSMIRSCIASTAGRPLTSGWIVIVKTA